MITKEDLNLGKIVWLEFAQLFGVVLKLNAKSVRVALNSEENMVVDYDQISLEGCNINSLGTLKPISETKLDQELKSGLFGYARYEEDTEITQENLDNKKIVPCLILSKNTAVVKVVLFENDSISNGTKILVLSPNVAKRYITV